MQQMENTANEPQSQSHTHTHTHTYVHIFHYHILKAALLILKWFKLAKCKSEENKYGACFKGETHGESQSYTFL